jgi:hypothetical protein
MRAASTLVFRPRGIPVVSVWSEVLRVIYGPLTCAGGALLYGMGWGRAGTNGPARGRVRGIPTHSAHRALLSVQLVLNTP